VSWGVVFYWLPRREARRKSRRRQRSSFLKFVWRRRPTPHTSTRLSSRVGNFLLYSGADRPKKSLFSSRSHVGSHQTPRGRMRPAAHCTPLTRHATHAVLAAGFAAPAPQAGAHVWHVLVCVACMACTSMCGIRCVLWLCAVIRLYSYENLMLSAQSMHHTSTARPMHNAWHTVQHAPCLECLYLQLYVLPHSTHRLSSRQLGPQFPSNWRQMLPQNRVRSAHCS
jgi:hypothetical protein